jgi:hypothetical protein
LYNELIRTQGPSFPRIPDAEGHASAHEVPSVLRGVVANQDASQVVPEDRWEGDQSWEGRADP